MTASRKLFIILDADGCVYNHKYSEIIGRLFLSYKQTICDHLSYSSLNDKELLVGALLTAIDKMDVGKMTRDSNDKIVRENLASADPDELDEDVILSARNPKLTDVDLYYQYIRWLEQLDPCILDKVLLRANEVLVNDIVERAKQDDVDSLTVMIGSNRQSVKYDALNCRRRPSRSFFHDLPILKNHLHEQLQQHAVDCAVDYDGFLTADVFADAEPGTAVARAALAPVGDDSHLQTMSDRDKILVLYPLLHYIASKHDDGSTLKAVFYDDLERVFASFGSVFGSRLDTLIPRSVMLERALYDGYKIQNYPVLQGGADIDHLFRDSVKLMAMLCGCDPSRKRHRRAKMGSQLNIKHFLASRARVLEMASTGDISLVAALKNVSKINYSTLFSRAHPGTQDEPPVPRSDCTIL